MKVLGTVVFGLLVSSSVFAQSQNFFEEWKGFSSPDIISSGFTHSLSELPLEGSMQIGPRAWSGHFWPSNQAGINVRWNSPRQETFKYKSPSQAAVVSMSLEQLAELSATEKYDLYMGRYDYPLKEEAKGSASRTASDWAGICHGWAPASVHHNEPTPKVMTNPDGIRIPFGSSDIKALLSYYYAFHYDSDVGQMGLRCYFGSWLGGARGCNDDLNAGAFHIVIANRLGIAKEGLMMDKDRYRQVWNQPVVGFKSTVLASNLRPSRKAAKSAVHEVRVETELMYIDESLPTWETVHGTENQKLMIMELQYRLEINAQGQIVGGEWESEARPDFIWDKARTPSFEGQLSGLSSLLND